MNPLGTRQKLHYQGVNMKRSGFTMIELIFVIVILGILSAVALPKMMQTQKSAQAQTVESFVGTANRSTLPSMYVSAVRTDGSIKSYNIDDYISIPKEIKGIDLSKCGDGSFDLVVTTTIGANIYCRDGNGTNPPLLSFSSSDLNTTLDSKYFE